MLWIFLIVAWSGFVRTVVKTGWWPLCTVLYAISLMLFAMVLQFPFFNALLAGCVVAVLCGVHFWALVRFEDTGGLWFVILLAGFLGVHAAAAYALSLPAPS